MSEYVTMPKAHLRRAYVSVEELDAYLEQEREKPENFNKRAILRSVQLWMLKTIQGEPKEVA